MTAPFPTLESFPAYLPRLVAKAAHRSCALALEEEIEAVADEDILEIGSLDEDTGPSTQRSPVSETLLAAPSRPVPPVVCGWLPDAVVAPVSCASIRQLPALLCEDDEVEPATVSSEDLEFSFEESGTRKRIVQERRPATVAQAPRAARLGTAFEDRSPLAHCG